MSSHWLTAIDHYCERTDPGFWSEPLNAVSNGNLQFLSTDTTFTNTCMPYTAANYAILPHWDDLLLTAQSFREITRGKMWGILQAIVPYLVAYAMPVFILAAVGGPYAMIVACFWIILPCTIVFAAALAGIDMLKVPRDMDETREGGAFAFERRRQWGPF